MSTITAADADVTRSVAGLVKKAASRALLVGTVVLAAACSSGDTASDPGTALEGSRELVPRADDLTDDKNPRSTATPTPAQSTAPSSRRTVCLTGAVDHGSPSNAGFRALCEASFVKGRLDDCRSGACKSTWGTFPSTTATDVWDALFAALDADKNGKLDASDPPCDIDLIGFSWGGVNAAHLAEAMQEDPRVGPTWRIARLVVLDAFQPLAALTVPTNVDKTFSFRHSKAPRNDCSRSAPLGPYLGLAPKCASTQSCADFDFSQSPNDVFGGMKGAAVGHCDVPAAAQSRIVDILR